MKVDLIDSMGTDLTVVNAARVSFDKESDWWADSVEHDGPKILEERDEKLIKYLANHNHWTPFGHPQVTFRVKAPIFVARQLGKHQVGMVWNEVSRRYVDSEPEFYEPEAWRMKAANIKQGSLNEGVPTGLTCEAWASAINSVAFKTYHQMLDAGVCPEQARMVLPQSMYTEWYWTGSLAAWSRVCKLRLDPHTQRETTQIAELVSYEMLELFPVSWKELMND